MRAWVTCFEYDGSRPVPYSVDLSIDGGGEAHLPVTEELWQKVFERYTQLNPVTGERAATVLRDRVEIEITLEVVS